MAPLILPAQDCSAAGAAGTSAAAHPSIKTTQLTQQLLVHQKLHAGGFDQFGTPYSFDAGILARTTPRTTHKHKGERAFQRWGLVNLSMTNCYT